MTKSDWRRIELLAAEREQNRRLRLIVAFQGIVIAAGCLSTLAVLAGWLSN